MRFINFKSGGIKTESEPTPNVEIKKEDNEELEEESNETRNQFSSDSFKNRYFDSKSKRKTNRSGQQFAGMRNMGLIGTDDNMGRWESHTKGIGAKLLQKMGYEPGKGLGKNLQGIKAPIEAKPRPGSGAIGHYGPEHKHKPMTPEEELEEKIKTNQKIKIENKWKKTEQTVKRVKKVIKSADQIIAENLLKPWNESDIQNVKVIDMTGPQQRVLSGYHQINQIVPEDDQMDVLSDITDQEIIENTKELKRESIRYNGLEEEIQRIKEVIEEEVKRCNIIESIYNQIESLSKRFKENEMTIEEVFDSYDRIRSENPMEFEALRLHEILIPTAFPLIRQLLSDWNPLENCQSINQMFIKLKSITTNEDSIYEMILWEIWMPRVRQNILNWPSIRQCDEMIAFLESWRPLLPDWLFDNIIEQIILPLLQKEVEDWNPLTDTVPIHSWLHPWLPLMVDRSLEHLYDPIRHKLSNALTNWHPSDGSAKLILMPWKGVFSVGSMEAFLNINIVPKLEISMQSLIINPHQQCLDAWHWVMSWQDLLSTPIMASILEKNFFPKWLNVLYNWLSNEPNYNEVNIWYIEWKKMLSTQLLAYPSIAEMLNRALQMMEQSVHSNGQMKPFNSFRTQQQMPTNPLVSTKGQNFSENSLNFRELVEHRARERGILFMPIPHRLHEGKQVYKLGKFIIHIDNKVLFVLNGNNWAPNSLQSVIDSAI